MDSEGGALTDKAHHGETIVCADGKRASGGRSLIGRRRLGRRGVEERLWRSARGSD